MVLDRLRVEPMRRRHLRGVLRIEQQANPHPWSMSLFAGELRSPDSRLYVVALDGTEVVGYAGAMLVVGDAHITNVGVANDRRRRGIASRMLLDVARAAIAEGQTAMTLEVRISNTGAVALYRDFGFVPAGVRKSYYSDNGEDALIMWANDINTTAYRARLLQIERRRDRATAPPIEEPHG